jgi:hypothetical protein
MNNTNTMKYRKLSSNELEELEKEFVDFLIVNGITADVWVDLKEKDNSKADSIIDSFSDVVFEGVFRKVKYLEFVTPTSLKCFQCLENEIILVGLDSENSSDIDFTANDWMSNLKNVKIYNSSKVYKEVRELELFNMVQKGASISDGTLFKKLCLAL